MATGTDALLNSSLGFFDDKAMAQYVPAAVHERFKACLISGDDTSPEDQKLIADGMFTWARQLGAVDFAHWFFPMRGGSGAVGGMIGALKMDTLIDLEWGSKSVIKPFKACLPHERLFQGETDGSSFPNGGLRQTHTAAAFTTWDRSSLIDLEWGSKSVIKPFKACLPHERLFQGETDGSSFPNGGLRQTHTAAAFTTWDRSSPPFVVDKVLRIPCAFVTHYGKCIDDKTPLLRSADAIKVQGLRLLKAIGIGTETATVYSYLGWEQEFFVVDAELYKKRPDLVNCGRTLIGQLPCRNQQADLNYFGPIPFRVDQLLQRVQEEMLRVGCPMAVRHNEVAPGQHEMSPIFCTASASSDSNALFMEVCNTEAVKLGLQVLFHEKPFAGINGSGKHCNWSIGTDTGLNFFYPGKTDDARKLFVTGIACLAYGLHRYNEMVRCAVAHAGNDHRLGAQEAPPAIISLYPGTGFEAHVGSIVAGGDLLGYKAEKKLQSLGCSASMPIEANIEDRNRTAPFPFCGNRFEFRAVGSSQNCAFPVMVCNAIMASGMEHMSQLIEGGLNHRDAVAKLFTDSKHVIFTGNGYSAEWPVEAAKRGLPNLNTTPKAIATFASQKNKDLFVKLGIYAEDETDARAEVMYESYNTTLAVEVSTMILMMETGIIPACAKDLAKFKDFPSMAGERQSVYQAIVEETEKLKSLYAGLHNQSTLDAEAAYLCDTVKPQMASLRSVVDKAESLLEMGYYPYPTYEQLLYSHHH
eukprot:CAMPEP_0172928408 /NCGR_PEP_ID=MMETSP1075-20121228/217961_1 /TAXON_ID=2916 /ORGANISM="Ceratium fusus, Strain PA161109" /LENGTH=752 /DNA_ID=CAMNT_0013789695 /DNA_START=58 /DNA_END=2316 /DNA_ORIENTATION=+